MNIAELQDKTNEELMDLAREMDFHEDWVRARVLALMPTATVTMLDDDDPRRGNGAR